MATAISSNHTYPYTEETLTVNFDKAVTVEKVVRYLAVNDINAVQQASDDSLVWTIPATTDESGNVTAIGYTIKVEAWSDSAPVTKLELPLPAGAVVNKVEWREPVNDEIPIVWLTRQTTGQRYFPITHWDAVLCKESTKLSSIIIDMQETDADLAQEEKVLDTLLVKKTADYTTAVCTDHQTDSSGADTGSYIAISPITLNIGSSMTITPANTDTYTCSIVDSAGNVVAGPADFSQDPQPELTYTALSENEQLYVVTSDEETGVTVQKTILTARTAGGSGTSVSWVEGTNNALFTNDDTAESVDVAKKTYADTINNHLGTVSNLTTTAKTDVVSAVNEIDAELGDTSTLTTTATSLVGGINELDADLGDKTTLTTTAKTSLVAAINEIDSDKTVTIAKEATATSGSAYTYTLTQGTAISPKIEMPVASSTAYGMVKVYVDSNGVLTIE